MFIFEQNALFCEQINNKIVKNNYRITIIEHYFLLPLRHHLFFTNMTIRTRMKMTAFSHRIIYLLLGAEAIIIMIYLMMGLTSCNNKQAEQPAFFKMEPVQENTSIVLWNPEVYDFETGNQFCISHFKNMGDDVAKLAAGACTSWRNGQYHGRNLDWYQADYGCLIVQMPKGGKVKHASVGTVNASTIVTQDFIQQGVLTDEMRKVLPAATIDGINDAGVAVNINIVPHQPGDYYIDEEGDLSCACVVRYVLDNAGSVTEAVDLLKARKVSQSIVRLAGDEAHYMISNVDSTVVVEFPQGEMQVVYFTRNEQGWYSPNGNPAIMANFYDYAAEQYGVGSDEFYNYHPTAMGVERWLTVQAQYDQAKIDVASNLAIAQSVWYFKNIMVDKSLWYTENAVPDLGYGKDAQGWYFMAAGQRVDVSDASQAMQGYRKANMETYWKDYELQYGQLSDPHVKGNMFWETSHSVVYDLQNKKGYLYPFENFYSQDGNPVVIEIVDEKDIKLPASVDL